MKAYLVLAAALSLGGCAVTSERPLFAAQDAAPHALAQGAWALHGPGCDVTPGQAPPDCAIPFAIRGHQLEAAGPSDPGGASSLGAMAGREIMTGPSDFLLVEGDPEILQLRAAPKRSPAGGGGVDGSPVKPGQVSYMAFRPLHRNEAGEADRGILSVVVCPKDSASVAGLTADGPGCRATTAAAVREQARHLGPLLSFFMTWTGPGAEAGR